MSLEKFRPGLEKALALVGTHSMADLVKRVQGGQAQLWVVGEAFIITEIIDYPQKRVLRFWVATGELDACIALSRRIMKWGKRRGCELALLTGRRGWTKPLRKEGWTEKLAVLSQEL